MMGLLFLFGCFLALGLFFLAAAALRAGLPGKRAAALLDCNTTEDALQSSRQRREGR